MIYFSCLISALNNWNLQNLDYHLRGIEGNGDSPSWKNRESNYNTDGAKQNSEEVLSPSIYLEIFF